MPSTSIVRYLIGLIRRSSVRIEPSYGIRPKPICGFEQQFDDAIRRRSYRRMIDIQPPKRGFHPPRHEFLRLRVDHAVLLRQEVPGRQGLPERLRSLLLQAGSVDRPLHGSEQGALLRSGVLRERLSEAVFRHPDEAVGVGCELRRLRMRLPSAEYFADGLALGR